MSSMSRSRSLERVSGELVEREAVARPVQVAEPAPPMVVYVQQPAPVVEPAPVRPSRLWPMVGWIVTIIGTALLLLALAGPPHIVRSDHKPPDLVNPSR